MFTTHVFTTRKKFRSKLQIHIENKRQISVIKDDIWKIKVPPNTHVFLWLIYYNKSLTRDNLAKRNWKGNDKNYSFCDHPQTVEHLFVHV